MNLKSRKLHQYRSELSLGVALVRHENVLLLASRRRHHADEVSSTGWHHHLIAISRNQCAHLNDKQRASERLTAALKKYMRPALRK